MIDREVAQQALEALEAVYGDSCDAIYALRAALAEPQNPCNPSCAPGYCYCEPEPAAPTPYTEADCLAAEKKWSAPAAPTVVEPCGWAQLGMLNGRLYLREVYDRTPYPPPADIVRNMNLVPVFAATPPRAALTEECLSLLDTAMDSLKYHQEQTRPIHLTEVTIQAIQEFLEKNQIGGPRNE